MNSIEIKLARVSRVKVPKSYIYMGADLADEIFIKWKMEVLYDGCVIFETTEL